MVDDSDADDALVPRVPRVVKGYRVLPEYIFMHTRYEGTNTGVEWLMAGLVVGHCLCLCVSLCHYHVTDSDSLYSSLAEMKSPS